MSKVVLAVVLLLISGCKWFVKEVPVYSDPIIITADIQYRTECKGAQPPDPEVYVRATTTEQREKLWANAYLRQTAALVLCNQKIEYGNKDIEKKIEAVKGKVGHAT